MCIGFKPIGSGIGIGNLAIWPLRAIDCQCRLLSKADVHITELAALKPTLLGIG
jgi:hypothetical protein